MASEALPKWVADEIKNAKFDREEEWAGSGYILDVNKKESKIDVQFYEKLPEGRHIATLDLPKGFDADSLEMAVVYMFKFKAFSANLSEKVASFLKEKYQLDMKDIYRFELVSAERLEAEAEVKPASEESEESDEE